MQLLKVSRNRIWRQLSDELNQNGREKKNQPIRQLRRKRYKINRKEKKTRFLMMIQKSRNRKAWHNESTKRRKFPWWKTKPSKRTQESKRQTVALFPWWIVLPTLIVFQKSESLCVCVCVTQKGNFTVQWLQKLSLSLSLSLIRNRVTQCMLFTMISDVFWSFIFCVCYSERENFAICKRCWARPSFSLERDAHTKINI